MQPIEPQKWHSAVHFVPTILSKLICGWKLFVMTLMISFFKFNESMLHLLTWILLQIFSHFYFSWVVFCCFKQVSVSTLIAPYFSKSLITKLLGLKQRLFELPLYIEIKCNYRFAFCVPWFRLSISTFNVRKNSSSYPENDWLLTFPCNGSFRKIFLVRNVTLPQYFPLNFTFTVSINFLFLLVPLSSSIASNNKNSLPICRFLMIFWEFIVWEFLGVQYARCF